ncbi:hypothetical protein ABPG74_010207 [Tetrahymena malaccensis]
MKPYSILPLLIIAGLLPVILTQPYCPYFTDITGNCVNKCVYPQIGNADSKMCMSDDSQCTSFYIQYVNTCVSKCPSGYLAQAAKDKKYQICIPCQYKDDAGKCYQFCPHGTITDYTTQKCLSSPSQCQAYYIKSFNMCYQDCPPTFTPDNTQTPKICVSCQVSGTCATTTNGNGNNQQPSNSNNIKNTWCNLYLAANMNDCLSQCPTSQIALPQVQGQSYIQCQMCPPTTPYVSYDGTTCLKQCNTGEILLELNCIQTSQCNLNLYTDTNNNTMCIDKCPSQTRPVQVKDQTYNVCQSCPSNQFLVLETNQCVDTCQIKDKSSQICLSSINSCNGYISSDQKSCLASCPASQFAQQGIFAGQYLCVDKCNDNQYIQVQNNNNIASNYCVAACPIFQFADSNKICTPVASCTNFLSMDGLACLTQCPVGQFPQSLPTYKVQICMPCMQKLSSDGKSCNDSCASNELYDAQLKQCQPSAQCSKIKQDGQCLDHCQPGYVIQTNNSIQTCISINACPDYVSSDRQSCVKNCDSNEGVITIGKQLFCVLCPLGLNSDGVSCKSNCPSNQIYDTTSQSCKDTDKCSGLLSANGQRCVSECQFPEVKPSSQATQCAYQCQSGQVIQQNVGCIDPSKCTDYISSNGQFCVQQCSSILEITGDTNSSPKTCQQCPQGQYPLVQSDSSIQCTDVNSDPIDNMQEQLKNAMSALGNNKITPIQQSTLKNTFQKVTFDLEQQLSQDLQSPSVKADKVNSLITQGVSTLKVSILNYLNKLTSYDATTNIQQASQNIQDQNQLLLGSNQVQIVAEKKKNGYSFKLKFNLQELTSNSVISLQQDDSVVPQLSNNNSNTSNIIGTGIGDATGQTNSQITAMQVTNLAVNPYCLSCPTGLTTIDTNTSTGRFRNLQSQSGQQYQLTYNVNPSQITKTICVSYDSNNAMIVNPTNINSAKNQITCTFTKNSSLYYDSNCQYISKNLCPSQKSQTDFNDKVSPSSSKLLNISLVFAFIFAIYI